MKSGGRGGVSMIIPIEIHNIRIRGKGLFELRYSINKIQNAIKATHSSGDYSITVIIFAEERKCWVSIKLTNCLMDLNSVQLILEDGNEVNLGYMIDAAKVLDENYAEYIEYANGALVEHSYGFCGVYNTIVTFENLYGINSLPTSVDRLVQKIEKQYRG